jgi:hypothetical protein
MQATTLSAEDMDKYRHRINPQQPKLAPAFETKYCGILLKNIHIKV